LMNFEGNLYGNFRVNPVVATFELIVAIVLSLLALTLPVVAGIVVIGLVFAISKLWRLFSKLRQG